MIPADMAPAERPVLPRALAGDPVAVTRFKREIAALGRCDHANVVKVLHAGQDGDRYFYRAGDTTVEISEFEYGYVQSNPSLYYFSQTVKVHVRMNRKRDGLPALPWKAT